jgi:hypothetical protein
MIILRNIIYGFGSGRFRSAHRTARTSHFLTTPNLRFTEPKKAFDGERHGNDDDVKTAVFNRGGGGRTWSDNVFKERILVFVSWHDKRIERNGDYVEKWSNITCFLENKTKLNCEKCGNHIFWTCLVCTRVERHERIRI